MQLAADGPLELAQAQAQVGTGEAIGRIETTKGPAFVTRTDGTKVKASVGLDIFQGDVIETEAKGSVGITFADNSTFSLADEGEMTIDEMVYDAGSQEGSAALSVAQGVFTFVSGQIAKTGVDAMLINTPTSTIGIRGTSLAAKVGSTKGDVFTLLEDQDAKAANSPAENGKLAGQAADDVLLAQAGGPGPAGEIVISNDVSSRTLNQPNATSSVTSRFSAPTLPIILPASVVNQVFGAAIVIAQQTLASSGLAGGDAAGGDEGGPGGAEQGAAAEGGTEAGAEAEGQAETGGEGVPGDGAPGEITGDPAAEGLGPDGPIDGAETEAELAAAEAFADALAGGGDLTVALAAATDAAAEVGLQAALASDPNIFGSPDAIESAMGGIIGDAMGDFGFDAGDPLSAGRGSDTAMDDQQEQFDEFAAEVDALIDESLDLAAEASADIVESFIEAGLLDPSAGLELLAGFEAGAGPDDFLDGGGEFGDFGGEGDIFDFGFGFLGPPPEDELLEFFDPFEDLPPDLPPEEVADTDFVSVAGTDSFTFINALNDVVTGSAGADDITAFGTAEGGDTFDGGTGNDTLTFSGSEADLGDHLLSIFETEYVILPTGDSVSQFILNIHDDRTQSITLGTDGDYIIDGTNAFQTGFEDQSWSITDSSANNSVFYYGGAGTDTVALNAGSHVISVWDGIEKLTLADGTNSITFAGHVTGAIETVTGGSSSDIITLGDSSVTVGNVTSIETIIGGTGTDIVTFGGGGNTTVIDGVDEVTGGTGTDVVTLANGGQTLNNVSAIETIIGGTGADIVNLADGGVSTVISGVETVAGGTGTDVVTLASGGQTLSNVSAVETVIGGSGADTIVVSGSGATVIQGGVGNDSITGGSGADRYVFSSSSNGVDTLASSGFATGSGGDILDFLTNGLSISGNETVFTDTLSNAGSLGSNGIFVVTDDALGTPTALATALNAGPIDTTATNDRIIVWEINSNTVGVGVMTSSDTTDNNNVTVTQLAEVTGLANQTAVDSFTSGLDANNFDIV